MMVPPIASAQMGLRVRMPCLVPFRKPSDVSSGSTTPGTHDMQVHAVDLGFRSDCGADGNLVRENFVYIRRWWFSWWDAWRCCVQIAMDALRLLS
jgi:hypothetical protein